MRTPAAQANRTYSNLDRRSEQRAQNSFMGFVINGNADIGSLADLYSFEIAPSHRVKTVTDYLVETLYGYPLTGDRVTLGSIELVVLKKSGRAVEKVGLDLRRAAATLARQRPAGTK